MLKFSVCFNMILHEAEGLGSGVCWGPHHEGQGASHQLSHSLNSLKGDYIGEYMGTNIGVIKGDTRSLDSGSTEKQICHPSLRDEAEDGNDAEVVGFRV